MDQKERDQNNKDCEPLNNTVTAEERLKPIRVILPMIVVILIIAVMCSYAFIQKKNIIANTEQITNQMAEYIAGNIANEMDYARSSILLISTTISQSMTSDTLENPSEIISPMIVNSPFDDIEYIRADGMNVMNIGEPFDASDRVYYIDGIKGNTGIWNNYHPKTSKETLMNFYTPLYHKGKISGVLTGYIAATTQITPLFETELYGQDLYGLLIDENDMVICSTIESEYEKDLTLDAFIDRFSPTDDQRARLHDTINNATETAASYEEPIEDGKITVTTIPETGWKVAIILPGSSLSAIIAENTRDSVITIVIISLILIAYASALLVSNIRRRKEIAKENTKLEEENRIFESERTEYYNTLGTLADIYNSLHIIDLVKGTVVEFNPIEEVGDISVPDYDASEMIAQIMMAYSTDEYRERALEFTDLNTLANRMQNKDYISVQLVSRNIGWFLASFITLEADAAGRPVRVIFTTQSIDEEKKQEEKLIREAQTDELTGLLNRRAYEDDIYAHNNVPESDHFVIMSLDVNGLKNVNDTLGHAAGDELLIGASRCMQKSFDPYGRTYRTGGDEFMAILLCDDKPLQEVLADFEKTMADWTGELVDSLSISYGYITKEEAPEMSVRELAIIADKRMYEAKAAYYSQSGIDRRKQ